MLSPQMREEEAEMEAEMEADDAFLQMKLLLPQNFNMTLNVEVEFGANGAKTGVKYLERPHRSQTSNKLNVRCLSHTGAELLSHR